ncbi:MAG: beta strand repeat-containing protein, partial [Flexibacteraceae bacterium]
FFNYAVSYAQSCSGTNITSNSNFSITTSGTYVITTNYSRTITVQPANVTICIASGVTFSGSINYWVGTGITINNNGTISSNLNYTNGTNLNNTGTITSKVTISGGGDIVNSGTISNEIELNGGGDLTNSGTLSHKITMNGGGTLTNSGIINASNRDININDGGNVINTGSITVQDFNRFGNGTLTQSGSGATMNVKKFDVRGTVNLNGGTITVTENVELNDNSTYNIASGTTLRLNKQLQINGGSTMNVGGQLFVKDELKNYSTVNISGGYVQAGKLTNTGSINSTSGSGGNTCGGSLSIDNSISNSGTISGGATGLYSCSHSTGQSNVTVIPAPTNGPALANYSLSRSGSVITGTFTAPNTSTTTPVTGYYVLVTNGSSISDIPSCLTDYKVGDVVGSSRVAAVLNGRTSTTFTYTYPGGSCGNLTFKVFPYNSSPAPSNCVKGGVTNSSLAISRTISLPVISGIISGNQLVCSGTSPGALTVSQFAGTVSKWQQSIVNNVWTDISGTSGLTTYTPGNITVNTKYRAVFSCSGTANGPELSVLIASAATTFVGAT